MRLMIQYLQEIKYKVYGTVVITITIIIILDNDAYESVRYTFEAEVLCYYNDYPFIHGNTDIKHLSGDHIIYWIEWLEDDSAVWDIQIDTRKYFDTLSYIYLMLMLDA